MPAAFWIFQVILSESQFITWRIVSCQKHGRLIGLPVSRLATGGREHSSATAIVATCTELYNYYYYLFAGFTLTYFTHMWPWKSTHTIPCMCINKIINTPNVHAHSLTLPSLIPTDCGMRAPLLLPAHLTSIIALFLQRELSSLWLWQTLSV